MLCLQLIYSWHWFSLGTVPVLGLQFCCKMHTFALCVEFSRILSFGEMCATSHQFALRIDNLQTNML